VAGYRARRVADMPREGEAYIRTPSIRSSHIASEDHFSSITATQTSGLLCGPGALSFPVFLKASKGITGRTLIDEIVSVAVRGD